MANEEQTLSIKDQIIEIIESSSPKQLQDSLVKFHPSDIALAFEELDEEKRHFVLKSLNVHVLADIFEHLDQEDAAENVQWLDNEKAAHILEEMDPDDAVDILNELNESEMEKVLDKMQDETADSLRNLALYETDTAGSIMTTDYIELKKGIDVKDAMKSLIANAHTTEGIQRLFVVDDNNFLEGVIELKKLIQARSPMTIDELIQTEVITANVNDDSEEVARLIQNYGIYILPIVNDNNQLQGVITMDDAADILDEETDEDYARFAAISSDEDINESVLKSAFHRLPWLIVLLFLGSIIATIIGSFETTLEQLTVLVFFLPLILDMAGNTGTQSLAVTVRGLSKDYFDQKGNAFKHVLKELRVGFYNGLGIGFVSFFTTFLFLTLTGQVMEFGTPFLVAITVSLSAFTALTFASAFGAFFPLLLHKIKIDPAVASGPFITTLNDIIGLLIYFSLAILIILN
ncbi:MAG: magnesium transporter [Candidatus Izemoplasmataceae bacterium]